LKEALDLYSLVTGMEINFQSSISFNGLSEHQANIIRVFPFQVVESNKGLKCLSFSLKQMIMVQGTSSGSTKRRKGSLDGVLDGFLLVGAYSKSVFEANPTNWHSKAYIPVSFLKKIRKKCFSFLWLEKREGHSISEVKKNCRTKGNGRMGPEKHSPFW
jgi:hypothetical protein